MAYDFGNRAGDLFHFSRSAYSDVLAIARDHGWNPTGTSLPLALGEPGHAWSGSYHGNCGQVVGDDDAKQLADALFRALGATAYIGDHEWREQVEAFARFCTHGTFQIC